MVAQWWPNGGPSVAQVRPKCGQSAAQVRPKCGPSAAQMLPKSGLKLKCEITLARLFSRKSSEEIYLCKLGLEKVPSL